MTLLHISIMAWTKFYYFSKSKKQTKFKIFENIYSVKYLQSEQTCMRIWAESNNKFAVEMDFFLI